MNSALLCHLHEFLLQCWEEGTMPQDMRDFNSRHDVQDEKTRETAATVTHTVEYLSSVSLGRPLPV